MAPFVRSFVVPEDVPSRASSPILGVNNYVSVKMIIMLLSFGGVAQSVSFPNKSTGSNERQRLLLRTWKVAVVDTQYTPCVPSYVPP